MHFANLLFSFLIAGLLAAPSTCRRGLDDRDGYAGDIYARDSFDQDLYRRDISQLDLYKRNLFDLNLDRRDLYERDQDKPAVYRRAGKAPPATPKRKITHKKATPKKCRAKRDTSGRLYTRAVKEIDAGTSDVGEAGDELKTSGLKTCIGVVGLSSNGKKVMGHLNGWNEEGKDYNMQLAVVRAKALAIGGSVKWTASIPDDSEGGPNLQGALAKMNLEVVDALEKLEKDFKLIFRKPRQAGKMSVTNEVTHDSCTY